MGRGVQKLGIFRVALWSVGNIWPDLEFFFLTMYFLAKITQKVHPQSLPEEKGADFFLTNTTRFLVTCTFLQLLLCERIMRLDNTR